MATKKTPRKTTARSSAAKKTAKKTPAKKKIAKKTTGGAARKKPRASADAARATDASVATEAGWRPPVGPVVVEREIGGRTLSLETGRMAKLADGAIVARYGDTMVLATAQAATSDRDDIDFFPLTVDYREKSAAAGKFPGGFFKREGRPTTREILTCRIIDRSIRPLFADGFRRETQVLSQVLSTDKENDSDVVAAIASFAALAISSIPNGKILGGCRIGLVDGKLKINPSWSDLQSPENKLNLMVSAHRDAIVMVEAGADQVSEELVLEALELAHEVCEEIAEMIDELVEKAGKPKIQVAAPTADDELAEDVRAEFGDEILAAPVVTGDKHTRGAAKKQVKDAVRAAFPPPADAGDKEIAAHKKRLGEILDNMFKEGERRSILDGRRADGRGHADIRDITIEVGVLPRVHGSSLFTRGETQALCTATLGTVEDRQFIDGIYPEERKRWLLHYTFPPFSVGEVRRFGGPGRREIGHGALAERSVAAVLPPREEFAYSLRVTSEILESNGSSSMASVCGATLALMDAGVPIAQPVAGIAMGLVVEGDEVAILSDILGSEDHCGDMDFKIAGTGKGITALQMDIKCEGLSRATLEEALEQARQGRLHILRKMLEVIRKPREAVSRHAPRLVTFTVPLDKVGAIIGPGGRTIRAMQDEFECRIAVGDAGVIEIAGGDADKVDACVQRIKDTTADVEVGMVYKGRVTGIKEFGAFVEILPGQEGLVHVSELSNGFIRSVTDAVEMGQEIEVKVIDIDDFGKVKLSRRALLPAEDGAAPAGGDAERPRARRDGERDRDRDRGRGRDRDRDRDRGERGRRRDAPAAVEVVDDDEIAVEPEFVEPEIEVEIEVEPEIDDDVVEDAPRPPARGRGRDRVDAEDRGRRDRGRGGDRRRERADEGVETERRGPRPAPVGEDAPEERGPRREREERRARRRGRDDDERRPARRDEREERGGRADLEDDRPRHRSRRDEPVDDDAPRGRPRRDEPDVDAPRARPRRDDADAPRARPRRDDADAPRGRPRRDDDVDAPRGRPRRDEADVDAPRGRARREDADVDLPRGRPRRADADADAPRGRPRRDDVEVPPVPSRRDDDDFGDFDDDRPVRSTAGEDDDRPRRRRRRRAR